MRTARKRDIGDPFPLAAQWSGRHVCAFASSPSDQLNVLISYLASIWQGRDAQVFILGERGFLPLVKLITEKVMVLATAGRTIQVSSLCVAVKDQAGRTVMPRAYQIMLEEQIAAAITTQHDVYVVGDLTSLFPSADAVATLLQHELWLDDLVKKWPVTIVCLYDLLAMGGEVSFQALRAHEAIILREGVVPNDIDIQAKGIYDRSGSTPQAVGSAEARNDRRAQETERLPSILQAIIILGTLLSGLNTEAEIAKVAVDVARSLFEADLSTLVVTGDGAEDSTMVSSYRDGNAIRRGVVRLSDEKTTRDAGFFNLRLGDLPEPLQGLTTDHTGSGSVITAPLLAMGRSLGLICVGHRTKWSMGPGSSALLNALAYQVASALQIARLKTEKTEGKKRAAALYEVTHALTTTLELSQVLHLVVEKACSLLNIDRCTMFLLDESKKYLRGVVSSTLPDDRARQLRKSLYEDLAAREAVESKKPVLIVDAPNDPRPLHNAVLHYGITNALYVPLVAHDQVIGTIDIDDTRSAHNFTEEEQELMLAFADQAAVAIENAMLFEREKQAVAKLQELNVLINDQHAKLQHSVSIHDQLTKMVLAGEGMPAIAETLAGLVGCPVLVEDQFHHLLAYSQHSGQFDRHSQETIALKGTPREVFSNKEVGKLLERARKEKRPVHIPPFPQFGMDRPRVVAPIVVGESVLGYVAVLENNAHLEELDLVALEHAASVFALEMTKQKAAFEAEMRLKGEFLEDLISGNFDSEKSVIDRGALLGYDLALPHQLVLLDFEGVRALDVPGDSANRQTMAARRDLIQVANRCATESQARAMIVAKDESIVALILALDSESDKLLATARRLAEMIGREVHRILPHLTVSTAIADKGAGFADLSKAYKQARWVLGTAKAFGKRGQIISTKDLGVPRILLQLEDKKELLTYIDETIGPLFRHDQSRHSALVKTLGAYLDHGCSRQATAQALFVHINTLHYRLEKISSLTGLDLHNADHCLDLQMALKIHRLAERWS